MKAVYNNNLLAGHFRRSATEWKPEYFRQHNVLCFRLGLMGGHSHRRNTTGCQKRGLIEKDNTNCVPILLSTIRGSARLVDSKMS